MHVDSTTILTLEEVMTRTKLRKSVRIHTNEVYTHGLFILDVAQAPWGCGTWPAFWSAGYNWPHEGETDVIENVHTNRSNQVAWHTDPGCWLTTPGNFTGTVGSTNCDANVNYNKVDSSIASFGQTFNEKGGGVYVLKWDELSIDVWFFYRSAIPRNILEGLPDPSTWSLPSASLSSVSCNIDQYFKNHMIIFDTTLCGDWAGTSYVAAGCPGRCEEWVTNPHSFDNATWSINYLKIYNKTVINTSYLEAKADRVQLAILLNLFIVVTLLVFLGR
ncbi:hypothetical protein FRC17_010995 [Serendipita sp. 399]|nr:hypothetical protein FRC17_010995 [Serendipita sp. 399]